MGASVTAADGPRILVLSALFPNSRQPYAGLFIRERMFRVGRVLGLQVVSPKAGSPLDPLVRWFQPHYRPRAPRAEQQNGFTVRCPRFLALPGLFRGADGFMMALGCLPLLYRTRETYDLIDAHFAYPDGYAASLLGRWLGKPVTITLRGTELPHSRDPVKRRRMRQALGRAAQVFAVSGSLARLAIELGADPKRVQVVGNGVDTDRFRPSDRHEARARIGLAADARTLISVGGLVERKGFHRVIEVLPRLLNRHPGLQYLIVGSGGPEGNYEGVLRDLIERHALTERVRFLGQVPPERLAEVLSAGDCFVLATSNEGWANVFLEAMACGLPVITTDVGGNAEVVSDPSLGTIVSFGDPDALAAAIDAGLARAAAGGWDPARIRAYAEANDWDHRVRVLVDSFRRIAARAQGRVPLTR